MKEPPDRRKPPVEEPPNPDFPGETPPPADMAKGANTANRLKERDRMSEDLEDDSEKPL